MDEQRQDDKPEPTYLSSVAREGQGDTYWQRNRMMMINIYDKRILKLCFLRDNHTHTDTHTHKHTPNFMHTLTTTNTYIYNCIHTNYLKIYL